MAELSPAARQVLSVHAPFIRAVVEAVRNRALLPQLWPMLDEATRHGWGALVAVLRRIVEGERGRELLLGLDEQDRVIAEAVLAGIENPDTLPALAAPPDAGAAAPGLAAMIAAAGRGDVQAFAALANMAEQMLKAGGDMARLGGVMRRLVDGERDLDILSRGMGERGRKLLADIVAQLDAGQ